MSTVVRYFEDDGTVKRIVEHRKTRRVEDDDGGWHYETVRRWLTIERGGRSRGWVEERELGDYVDPSDVPQ